MSSVTNRPHEYYHIAVMDKLGRAAICEGHHMAIIGILLSTGIIAVH